MRQEGVWTCKPCEQFGFQPDGNGAPLKSFKQDGDSLVDNGLEEIKSRDQEYIKEAVKIVSRLWQLELVAPIGKDIL